MFVQVTNQLLSIGVLIILARLLNPEDFGTVALSDVFFGFAYLFADLGMGPAIIQKQKIDDNDLSTSFWVSVATGLGIALILCAVSPLIAAFYDKEILKYVVMLSSTAFLLGSFSSIHRTLLTKKLEFNKIALINITSKVISSIASVGVALLGFGVWSLVLGGVVAQAFVIPLAWYMERWRPRFHFDKKSFAEMFNFSFNLLAFNFFNYFARNFDNLIIGRVLGAEILGYYSLAYNVMLKPLQYISWSVGNVLFPALSSLQENKERIRSAYTKVVRSISLLTFPMMFGLITVSREFILTFYGDKWEAAILPLQLLCVVGAMQSIGTTVGIIFNSQGRSDLQLKWGVFASIVYVIAFLIGVNFGLVPLILLYMGACSVLWPLSHYFANRLIGLEMTAFFKTMIPATAASILMVLSVVLLKSLYFQTMRIPLFWNMSLLVLIGMISYAGFIQLFKVPEVEELKRFLNGRILNRLRPALKKV